ncbi:MAG: EAL domain-containing protein [Gammaproteobacteria bacterium]|nr:EAL domain-containing protein [Gammaproteobacteria bacterium]
MDIVEACTLASGHQVIGRFKGWQLHSVFQPIVSLAHEAIVGCEGLLRATDGGNNPISPLAVIAHTRDISENVLLDRLCRNLHLRNYRTLGRDTGWLFLNINPRVVVDGKNYGSYFMDLLQCYRFPAHRIVVEILEGAIQDEAQLAEAIKYYKELGCLVAIDDFGAGHSNFERIWRQQPHIVKLDRSMIVRAAGSHRVRRLLGNIISLLHEAGCLVIAEGVETKEEALISIDGGADFAQGYYFSRPSSTLVFQVDLSEIFFHLQDKFQLLSASEFKEQQRYLAPYYLSMQNGASALASGAALETACFKLLKQDKVLRCYLLDESGRQVGANLVPPAQCLLTDPRFAPLANPAGANWSRRPYFRRAIEQPNQVQLTRPYLSITDARMCVTLSIAVQIDKSTQILCCDLDRGGDS